MNMEKEPTFKARDTYLIERSLEVKLPTIWIDGKAEVGRVRAEKRRREKIREEKDWEERRRRWAAGGRKGRKVAIHRVFQMICGSGGSKSRLAKAAGAEPCGQMRDQNSHAIVTRSTFESENAKNISRPEHFLKLRCRKSAPLWRKAHFQAKSVKTGRFGSLLEVEMLKNARPCGANHISKSNCTQHTILGSLLEVDMSKKWTPLWREANFQDHFWRFRCGFEWQVQGVPHLAKVSKRWRFCSSFYVTLRYSTLITLHSTPLYYTTRHDTTPHHTTRHDTTLHYTPPR